MSGLDTEKLKDIDFTTQPIEVSDRVWWVGHVLENDSFQCHVYLIEQGDQSILIDPGSRLTFDQTFNKIEQIIPFSHIRYFVCQHQDPDISGALPEIDDMIDRDDAVVITHWRAEALLKSRQEKEERGKREASERADREAREAEERAKLEAERARLAARIGLP